MTATDTNYTDPKNPSFVDTDRMIVIGTSGTSHNWRKVYTPSAEAVKWDGADSNTSHAMGSRYGGFAYCQIKVTGRKDRYDVAGFDQKVRAVRVTVEQGTEDEETFSAWLVGGGDSI